MIFESVDLLTFPADECVIPLRINHDFFKSTRKRLVIIKDVDKDCLMFKNLYPCLGEKDGRDIFGFVAENDLEFYNLENPKFVVKGFSNSTDIDEIIKNLIENQEEVQ